MTQPTFPDLLALARGNPLLAEHVEANSEGGATARFGAARFSSAFSPIFDLGSYAAQSTAFSGVGRLGDEIGFEAKLDARGTHERGTPVTAREFFASIADDQRLVELDRLSRTIHAINFFGANFQGLLFLNVHERLLKSVRYDHGHSFSAILHQCGLNPARVVIEIPEPAAAHRTFLNYLIRSYQGFGFKVAANLPNAGQIVSMADVVRPDYLKIDAKTAIRDSVVKALTTFAARLDVPLIFKRVNDEAQFQILQQCDIRFVQGDYLSRPLDGPAARRGPLTTPPATAAPNETLLLR